MYNRGVRNFSRARAGDRNGGGRSLKSDDGFSVLRWIAWVTTLGISLITPVVLAVYAALWLQKRFALGGWVVIAGILLGLGGAGVSFWRFTREAQAAARRRKEKK